MSRPTAALSLLLIACTAPPEQPLQRQRSPEHESSAIGHVTTPPEQPTDPPPSRPPDPTLPEAPPEPPSEPEPTITEPPPPDPASTRRGSMWRVVQDTDAWIADLTGHDACTVALPRFPALSPDGRMLALALGRAPVAEDRAAVVRLYRVEDGALLRNHTLLGPEESRDEGLSPARMHDHYCRRLTKLARSLGDYEPMPELGGWDNPIRDRLPEGARPWPRIVSDGATRAVDMAVADIVIASAWTDDPDLRTRARAQRCDGTGRGQFSTVWSAAGVRVYRRGPCGC